MKLTNMILFYAQLFIGIISIMLLFGTYIYIIIKNKKLDAIFLFYEYATPIELKFIKIALIGYLVSVVMFIIS